VATPPAEIQPAQLAARLTPQAAVVPALAPPPTVANIATTPAPPEPRSMAVGPIAIDDGPVRISVRFDEPRVIANPGIAVPSSNPLQPVPVPPPTSPRTSSANAAVEAPTDAASPWDAEGPTGTVDLDTTARKASPLETLLTTHAAPSTPPAAPAAEAPAAVPAKPVDELEALMTGAKELFDLGYFSGSLELVEKVLRKNPNHEGARAYLKRNESTLMRMYESKIGSMGTVPRQLVPPDEVIWLNMHHRAGFILSQVDGTLSYEDLLEISGMDRFDTVRILAELVQNGIIGC
jgi:hypothetical protein